MQSQKLPETGDFHGRVDVQAYGYGEEAKLGISALPGCRFKDCWRDIKGDIKTIKSRGIEDVFVLCTRGELNKYRVPDLLSRYKDSDVAVHHHPILDGQVTALGNLLAIVEELQACLKQGRKILVHCYGGLGRSCLVACALLMHLDETITGDDVIKRMRDLRGKGAVQSVKQYNCIMEMRTYLSNYRATKTNPSEYCTVQSTTTTSTEEAESKETESVEKPQSKHNAAELEVSR